MRDATIEYGPIVSLDAQMSQERRISFPAFCVFLEMSRTSGGRFLDAMREGEQAARDYLEQLRPTKADKEPCTRTPRT